MGKDAVKLKLKLVGFDGEPVNEALKEHSVRAQDWDFKQTVATLHEWAVRFNEAFQLGLPTPVIRLDRIGSSRYGHYCYGRNGFGLKYEIALNTKYIDRPFAQVLGTLLHEQLHAWQGMYGRPGKNHYHNVAFRNKARLYGLVIDERGHTLGFERGRFTELLSRHDVDTLALPMPGERPYVRPHGDSKMRKWRCGCPTIVRCAVELAAHCDRCGARFEEARAAW
jgi:hypothetical protein